MNRYTRSILPLAFTFATLVTAASPFLHAATPLGGLTVAVSPDGATLVAAGDSRSIFSFDPVTLEVKERIWIETTVTDLAFNQDGSVLAVFDTSNEVRLYSVGDWTLRLTLTDLDTPAASTSADLLAGYSRKDDAIRVHSLTDGSEKQSIPVPEKIRLAALGISPDGARLALIETGADDETETKVAYSDIPKDLKGNERETFVQKNDGRTSRYAIYQLADGTLATESTLYYTTSGSTRIALPDERIAIINYSNVNALISPDGSVELFKHPAGYQYGIGLSPDHREVFVGGLATGCTATVGGEASPVFNLDRLPGWPEYFKGFASTPDGTVYAATTAFRIVRIKRANNEVTAVPVR